MQFAPFYMVSAVLWAFWIDWLRHRPAVITRSTVCLQWMQSLGALLILTGGLIAINSLSSLAALLSVGLIEIPVLVVLALLFFNKSK